MFPIFSLFFVVGPVIGSLDANIVLVGDSDGPTYTWQQADDYCRHHYGTSLATLKNDYDAEGLYDLVRAEDVSQAWLGLHAVAGSWTWASGFPCENCGPDDSTHFTANARDGDCVTVSDSAAWSRRMEMLVQASCTDGFAHFICDMSVVGKRLSRVEKTVWGLDEEVNAANGKVQVMVQNLNEKVNAAVGAVEHRVLNLERSRYIFVDTPMSWDSAQRHCTETYGTDLATITDDVDARAMLALKETHDTDFWIGLNTLNDPFAFDDSEWQWVSGFECKDCSSVGSKPTLAILYRRNEDLQPEPGKLVTTIDILSEMHFEMDIIIHSFPTLGWDCLFQCGSENGERYPGIFLNPKSNAAGHSKRGFFVALRDVDGGPANAGGSSGDALNVETSYHLEVEYSDSQFVAEVDGRVIWKVAIAGHSTHRNMPCWASANFRHNNGDVTISNLHISSVSERGHCGKVQRYATGFDDLVSDDDCDDVMPFACDARVWLSRMTEAESRLNALESAMDYLKSVLQQPVWE